VQPKSKWYIGLDLGQRRDFSALACLELSWQNSGRCPVTFEWIFVPSLALLSLDRFPLGTDYEQIPNLLGRRVDHIDAMPRPYDEAAPAKNVVIDGGGPGPPVIDRIRKKMAKLVTVAPIIITGGRGQSSLTNGYTGVPRRTLISDVLLLIGNRTLQMPPDLDHRHTLETEFSNLSGGSSQPVGRDAHDDLVIALALGVWGALRDVPELLPDRPLTRDDIWEAEDQRTVPPPKEYKAPRQPAKKRKNSAKKRNPRTAKAPA
ncbi:MAG: hypothetical protein ACKV2U_24900, partial [Bryobacteraceae bacterium]